MRIPRAQVLSARSTLEAVEARQRPVVLLIRALDAFNVANVTCHGMEVLPPDEPVLILATHQNSHDAHVLGYAYYRRTGVPLSLFAKKELDDMPVVGPILRDLGAIAIDRTGESSNRSSLVEAMARFRAGGSVGIFAEGKRTYGGNIAPIKEELVGIARRAGVDIVTAGIYGPSRPSPFMLRPLTIAFSSRTRPGDVDDAGEHYRRELDRAYRIALAAHHGRPWPTD